MFVTHENPRIHIRQNLGDNKHFFLWKHENQSLRDNVLIYIVVYSYERVVGLPR